MGQALKKFMEGVVRPVTNADGNLDISPDRAKRATEKIRMDKEEGREKGKLIDAKEKFRPTEMDIQSEIKRIQELIKNYQGHFNVLSSSEISKESKKEMKEKMLREIDFHLASINKIGAKDEEFLMVKKKLESVGKYIEMS